MIMLMKTFKEVGEFCTLAGGKSIKNHTENSSIQMVAIRASDDNSRILLNI
jgi:hypothetical protein